MKEIVIYSDRQGPLITIENLNKNGKQVIIKGSLYDDAGVSELLINKQPVVIQKNIDTDFSAQLPQDADKLELTAKDSLGNETVMQVSISSASASLPVLYANLNIAMGDSVPPRKDTDPPQIELMGGLTKHHTVYQESLYVQAEVSDNTMIDSLKINEKPIFRRKGKKISFGEMIKLNDGENRIIIKASDIAGNTSEKQVIVIRKTPEAFQLQKRLGLAISLFAPDFEQNDRAKKTAGEFRASLENAFQSKERFRVLKDKENCLITGKVVEGSDLEFSAQMIDSETKEVLVSADVYHQKKSPEILRELAEGMANIFIRKYPMLTGNILHFEGNLISTNIGRNHAEAIGGKDAKIPKRLIVYRDIPMDRIIGDAQIIFAREDKSTAEILKDEAKEVKPNDKVITR